MASSTISGTRITEAKHLPTDPTIFDEASKIHMPVKGKAGRKDLKNPVFVTDGLKRVPFRKEVGYAVIEPEELASLHVPVAGLSEAQVIGYQRSLRVIHAREIAWAMLEGKEMPAIAVSLDEYGNAFITDGQHRVIGALIARRPLEVVIKQRSYAQARELFQNQYFAKRLDSSHMVLISDDAMSTYVQDALTDPDGGHPWSDMVSEKTTKTKLNPATMHRLVTMFGCDTIGSLTPLAISKIQKRFNRKRADELAELIGAFGRVNNEFSRDNNPIAYTNMHLSALTQAAVHIFIRNKDKDGNPLVHPSLDKERWLRHMVSFPWQKYAHINSSAQLVDVMLAHWNWKKTARKVKKVVYGGRSAADKKVAEAFPGLR